MVSPAVKLSMLLGSPVAETTISMQSWPNAFVMGVHANGPTIFSCGVVAAAACRPPICAVVIGCRSFGQSRPAAGLAVVALHETSLAIDVPRFLTLT